MQTLCLNSVCIPGFQKSIPRVSSKSPLPWHRVQVVKKGELSLKNVEHRLYAFHPEIFALLSRLPVHSHPPQPPQTQTKLPKIHTTAPSYSKPKEPLTSKCSKLFLQRSNCEFVKPSRSAKESIIKVTTERSRVWIEPCGTVGTCWYGEGSM